MSDEIKRQTAHLSITFGERPEESIDPDDLVNPEDVYDDLEDSRFGDDIDKGGSWDNMSLTCLTDQPVPLGNPAVLRLSGISTSAGLVLASSWGSMRLVGTRIPETITETLTFVNDDVQSLSYLPEAGTITYSWIGTAPAIDRVVFDYRDVTLSAKHTGLLSVTYTTLYMELRLTAVTEEPDGVTAGDEFEVLAAAAYGDCTASVTVRFKETATDAGTGRGDGYAAGYQDGSTDKEAESDYGTSYDAAPPAGHSDAYNAAYALGYDDGYGDGFGDDPYNDDDPLRYAQLVLRVVDYCTGDPIVAASVYVAGVLQGQTNSFGLISLKDVVEGQALKITAVDYTASDLDAIANDFIPRVQ